MVSNLPEPEVRPDFAWTNAWALMHWCQAAYDNDAALQVIRSRATDADCAVAEREDCSIIVFRGSQTAQDYLQDFKFTQRAFLAAGKLVQIHAGFLEDYESVITPILQWASAREQKPVFVTGHSLGGALAILCALKLAVRGFDLQGVYTFGQPRVGNREFAAVYDATVLKRGAALRDATWRIVNANDIVPRVPLIGYWHSGTEVLLPVGGGYVMRPAWERSSISNLLGLWLAWRRKRDVLIRDHHLSEYAERMQRFL